jgi:hypothetical protein
MDKNNMDKNNMDKNNINTEEDVFGFIKEIEMETDFGFKDEENSCSQNDINNKCELLNSKMLSINQFNYFKKKYNNKNIDILFDDLDSKRINYDDFLDNVLNILNQYSN